MTLSRRGFLRLSGAAGGALAIGVHLPGCALLPGPSELSRTFAATGELAPNAWLRIGADDRIVFLLDRVEMGQGTMTSHATLLAEELEVDPRRIEVQHAPADRAYDNPDPELGFQITGGSSSVRTSWHPLRQAGAASRELLRHAAAATWAVALAECRAEDGAVVHAPSGRRLRYGELVAKAATLPIPEDVPLKPPAQFRWIGKSVDRLDGPQKVDGSAVFGIDVVRPGMVQAVVVRPPVRGGKLRRFQAPPDLGALAVFPIASGLAVVAPTYWQARRAAARVTVEWEHGAFAAVSSDALTRRYQKLAAGTGERVRVRGNVDRALAKAKTKLEAEYSLPYLAHAPMEPMNATAHVADGRCEVWAPTQAPGIARAQVAEALGLDQRDVEIHTTMLGGGFGRRLVQDYAVEAARISAHVGKPVKVTWSREEDQNNDFYRPMAVSRIRGALDDSGAPIAWHHHLVTQSILDDVGSDFIGALVPGGMPRPLARFAAASAPGAFRRGVLVDNTAVEGAKDVAYDVPNLTVEWTRATSPVKSGFWRAVGHSHTAFVTESFLDELAHAGKQDPVALRRRLLGGQKRHLAVLERAAKEAGWGSPLPAGRGRGVAVHASFHSVCAQVIEASVERDSPAGAPRIRVHRVVAALDCGRVVNPELVRAQVESAVVFGLSAALEQQITFEGGQVQETNFHRYRLLRMHECPVIEVHLIDSEADPTGVGEPPLPPVAGALGNALFAATGLRLRSLPLAPALRAAEAQQRSTP